MKIDSILNAILCTLPAVLLYAVEVLRKRYSVQRISTAKMGKLNNLNLKEKEENELHNTAPMNALRTS